MAREEFRFVHTLRVRYNEIDGQQIVYNARYMDFCDVASTEYFRAALGRSMHELARAGLFETATVHAELDYFRSFSLDDLVDVGVRCTAIGTTSLTFQYEMWQHGEEVPYFRSTAIYVNFDPHARAKRPVPAVIREAIARLEGWERA